MKAIATIALALSLTSATAQKAVTLPHVPPQPDEPGPGWYMMQAGKQYDTGMFIGLAGLMVGGGLMAYEDTRTAGAVVAVVGFSVGCGYMISGNSRLQRAGFLLTQPPQVPVATGSR